MKPADSGEFARSGVGGHCGTECRGESHDPVTRHEGGPAVLTGGVWSIDAQ